MRNVAAHDNEHMPQHWSPQMKCDCCRLQRQRFGKQRHLVILGQRGMVNPYPYIDVVLDVHGIYIYIIYIIYIYMFMYIILYHNKKFCLHYDRRFHCVHNHSQTTYGLETHPHSLIISLGQIDVKTVRKHSLRGNRK